MVGGRSVAPVDDEVATLLGKVLRKVSLHFIFDTYASVGCDESSAPIRPWRDARFATGAGIRGGTRDLLSGTDALENLSAAAQFFPRSRIELAVIALPNTGSVADEAMSFKGFKNVQRGSATASLRVEIIHAQQPFPSTRLDVQIARDGGK